MATITIVIPGKPIAKKRPRFARRGKFVTTYNDQQTEEGKFIVLAREQFKRQYPYLLANAIRLECDFCFELPASAKKSQKDEINSGNELVHVKKPDLDNLVKFVKDCLNGQAWKDDSQVCQLVASKLYGNTAQTVIVIKELDNYGYVTDRQYI